ncbi:MAG: ABC transporter permease [Tepidanaerobacteraceae bacterium]|jgi:ribose/xylose/arabinose/galactoside ABC-type transport system permease subunit|nr:ABC transporter permease [Tepidanaerobacteraceae bacterium]
MVNLINSKNKFKKVPGILFGLIAVVVIFSVTTRYFFTLNNFINILEQASILVIASFAMTLTILLGKIDMSIGSIMSLTGVVTGLMIHNGMPVWISVFLGVVAGALLGMFNGYLISYQGFDFWIVTFSSMGIIQSLALVITNGATVPGFGNDFRFLGDGSLFGLPVIVLIASGITILLVFLTLRTTFGSNLYSVGGSEQISKYAGINTEAIVFKTYILSGILAGIAGIVLASKVNSASPIAGSGYEFDAIAATLIGGTPFEGGRGGIVGTLIGALIIAILMNGLNLYGFTPPIQFTLIGFIIVLIIIIDVLNEKYKAKKWGK